MHAASWSADAADRSSLDPGEVALVAEGKGGRRLRRVGEGEKSMLSAFAPVAVLGWGVVAERPSTAALRPVDRVRHYTLFWATASLALTAALGLVLARSVAAPVARLSAAARAVTAGDYGQPVEESESGDELSQLARSFNHMTAEVRRRDVEIRSFNAELASRVDQKTAELREAQDQNLEEPKAGGTWLPQRGRGARAQQPNDLGARAHFAREAAPRRQRGSGTPR